MEQRQLLGQSLIPLMTSLYSDSFTYTRICIQYSHRMENGTQIRCRYPHTQWTNYTFLEEGLVLHVTIAEITSSWYNDYCGVILHVRTVRYNTPCNVCSLARLVKILVMEFHCDATVRRIWATTDLKWPTCILLVSPIRRVQHEALKHSRFQNHMIPLGISDYSNSFALNSNFINCDSYCDFLVTSVISVNGIHNFV